MPIGRITMRQWIAAAAAIALLAFLFIGGKRLLDRFDQMERRVSEASEYARRAAERADRASTDALRASREAQSAAQTRKQAEEAKAVAETRAREAQHETETARAEVDRLRQERQEELDRMQRALSRFVETRRTALGLVMNLPDKALRFDFDSAQLKPQGRELLSRIAGILLASEGYGLAVYGHTDDVGTAEYNQQLSERRAEAVRRYISDLGIDPEIISIKGYGKSSPVARGTGEDDRARNRRVEIALTDTSIEYVGSAPKRTN